MKLNLGHFFIKHPYLKIIVNNTFTLFNFVNLILALMVASVGSYKNMLFILIAIANTLISIINGVRAQTIVNKLHLLSEQKPTTLKDGKPTQVPAASIQKGDIIILSLGDQVMFDSVVTDGVIEVNESFITGEQESIAKHPGDRLISGSFVVSGTARAEVQHIGDDNFVSKLQKEASTIKTADSKLFKLMNNIVKYISYALIPIGILLLWARFRTEADTATAITSTVAALINMIPEGLILLTSSVLALATIRLSRRKVLVQDLYAIETLARVNTIALDKTGTLTTGNMTVHDILLPDGTAINLKSPTTLAEKRALEALASILSHQTAENATTSALRAKLAKMGKFEATREIAEITEVIPFSSERKCSGIRTKDAEYLMGAVEFLTHDAAIINQVKSLENGHRAIAVVVNADNSLPKGARSVVSAAEPAEPTVKLLGIARLDDEIRPTAPGIISYFYDNDIDVKIISGDDLAAVTEIAQKVGVHSPHGINLSDLKRPNYNQLVGNYNIFTRVTPSQKKQLIRAIKATGHTVAMTGDGVNDILAMREADVSLAIGEGSDAARRAAKFVLLDSGYDSVPAIIDEGRQSINNLERSTSLFLAKTVYASILAILFVVLPLSYPFSTIEMSLLNFACIGFPGLVLAIEKNTARPKNRFRKNILQYSIPTGLSVSLAMLILSIIAEVNSFTRPELTTASVTITFTLDLILIYQISKPLNRLRGTIFALVAAVVLVALFVPFVRNFFEFTTFSSRLIIPIASILALSIAVFFLLQTLQKHFLTKSPKSHIM